MAACSVWWRLMVPRLVPVPHGEARVDARRQLGDGQRPHPDRGKLDGQRDAVEPPAEPDDVGQVRLGEPEPADRGRGALCEQLDRVACPGADGGAGVGAGTGSGPSLSTSSPGTCSGCLLVASTLMWLVSRSTALTNRAQAAVRCSQVSRISSSFLPRRSSSTASSRLAVLARCRPRRSATVSGSSSGSARPDNSTRQLPSAELASAAARSARRVLPTPPGPVTVTRRAPASRPASRRARRSARQSRRRRQATASVAARHLGHRAQPGNSSAPHVVAFRPPHYLSPRTRVPTHHAVFSGTPPYPGCPCGRA